MLNNLISRKKLYWIILTCTSFLAVLGLYPGMGGEGQQRDVSLWENKVDSSGFVLALFYDYWPNFFNSWLYSLSLFQIVLYLIGTKFIYGSISTSKMRKFLIIISTVGVFFMFQVVRDATALSLYVLGFGVLLKSKSLVGSKNFIVFFGGVCVIILGTLFKPVLAPIVALIFYVFCTKEENTVFYSKLVRVSITIFIALSPFMIDKILASELKMTQVHAEQQLFIFDITKMYCWGHSQESVAIAKETITPFLAPGSNHETLCASLEPMGWDDLRRSIRDVDKSPAVIWYKGDDRSILSNLMFSWVKIIRTSPFEWLQIKVIDAAQVLFMANSIYIEPLINTSESQFLKIGDLPIKLLFTPIQILDKLRVYSLGFALLIGFILILVNGRFKKYDKNFDRIVFKFILININTWLFLTLLFIANPGRYTLPFVILSYMYLIVALEQYFTKAPIKQK